MAELVIARFFLRVGQHFIRLVDLFEVDFRLFVARVQVRVVFFCRLTIGFFDLIFRSALGYAQHLVIIAFIGHGVVSSNLVYVLPLREDKNRE